MKCRLGLRRLFWPREVCTCVCQSVRPSVSRGRLVAAVAAAAAAFIAAVTCKDHTRARIAAINAILVAAVSGGLLTEF